MLTLSDTELEQLVAAIKESNSDWEPGGSAIEITRELAIKLGMKPGDDGYPCNEKETLALMTPEERVRYFEQQAKDEQARKEAQEVIAHRQRLRENPVLASVEAVKELRAKWSK